MLFNPHHTYSPESANAETNWNKLDLDLATLFYKTQHGDMASYATQ